MALSAFRDETLGIEFSYAVQHKGSNLYLDYNSTYFSTDVSNFILYMVCGNLQCSI